MLLGWLLEGGNIKRPSQLRVLPVDNVPPELQACGLDSDNAVEDRNQERDFNDGLLTHLEEVTSENSV